MRKILGLIVFVAVISGGAAGLTPAYADRGDPNDPTIRINIVSSRMCDKGGYTTASIDIHDIRTFTPPLPNRVLVENAHLVHFEGCMTNAERETLRQMILTFNFEVNETFASINYEGQTDFDGKPFLNEVFSAIWSNIARDSDLLVEYSHYSQVRSRVFVPSATRSN